MTAYYTCGVVSIWAALRAQTAVGRGLPMLALLLVRLAAFGARLVLEGWAGTPALHHYFAMEARWVQSPVVQSPGNGRWMPRGHAWLPAAAVAQTLQLQLPTSRCSCSRWPAAPSTC